MSENARRGERLSLEAYVLLILAVLVSASSCSGKSVGGGSGGAASTAGSAGALSMTQAGSSGEASAGEAGTSDSGSAGRAGSGGASDMGDAGTGGADTSGAGSAGAGPIVAPDDTWTWLDFPASKCANGTPTGIGVNPHAGATDLVIYLEGGGSCFDGAGCWGAKPTATNLTGFDATTFAASAQLKYAVLRRDVAANPLKAMNMVFVPYCTGDLHAGATTRSYQVNGAKQATYFWGARDMEIFLAKLVPRFAKTTTRVHLLGTSAGGFGTLVNFDRVATAFGVPVDILDDSGPPITAERDGGPVSSFAPLAIWGYTAPTGCVDCTSFPAIYAYDRGTQPESRFGLLSFAQDTTIAPDFGYTLPEFATVIQDFTTSISDDQNAATFVVTNDASHVVESDPTLAPQFLPWITKMVTHDATWTSATYAHP
jgi:Pectinacetylesterase